MTKPDPFFEVQLEAERLLEELKITELPVDPYKIVRRLDIELRPMPPNTGGASGMLLRVGNEFGIGYPTHVENEGFKRFSIGHELGHFRLPGHVKAVMDANGRHLSHAGFVTNNRYELEADHFAAALLMPKKQFSEYLCQLPEGLRGIEALKTLCITSLEATAIRYTQCSCEPIAVIRSDGNTIDYAFMSDALIDFPNLNWIKKRTPIPSETITATFNTDTTRIRRASREFGTSDMADWFSGCTQDIVEEVIGLGRYGKTLTVLTGMERPENDEDDDSELVDSWTPKFGD